MGSCVACEDSERKNRNDKENCEPYPSIEDVIIKREIEKRKKKRKNGSTASRDSKQSRA